MKSKDIIVIVLVIIALGVNIYRRYLKNKKGAANTGSNAGSLFSSHQKDDDYEPYSNK